MRAAEADDPGLVYSQNISTGDFEWPRATEMEQAVIGAMIAIPEYAAEGLGFLQVEDFHFPEHQHALEAMKLIHEAGFHIDSRTVIEFLQEMGASMDCRAYIRELASFPTILCVEQLKNYMRMIRDHRIRRDVIALSYDNIELALAEIDGTKVVEAISNKLMAVSDVTVKNGTVAKAEDFMKDLIGEIEERGKNPNCLPGLSTGWVDLNRLTGGFCRGDLIVVAARPSMGKTAFALNIIEQQVVKDKVPVLFFSMEMSKNQVGERLLSSLSTVRGERIKNGVGGYDLKMLQDAAKKIPENSLVINESVALTPALMRMEAKQVMRDLNNKLGLIVVDYLQLMSGSNKENKTQEITEISKSLKELAKELKVPVIALSQLSRDVEKRSSKVPMLSDLRESGAIEQDADIIIFLYRDDYYNKSHEERSKQDKEEADIIVAKHRNGSVGSVKLIFNKPLTRFENKTQ
jgi:replicative DNA helicase